MGKTMLEVFLVFGTFGLIFAQSVSSTQTPSLFQGTATFQLSTEYSSKVNVTSTSSFNGSGFNQTSVMTTEATTQSVELVVVTRFVLSTYIDASSSLFINNITLSLTDMFNAMQPSTTTPQQSSTPVARRKRQAMSSETFTVEVLNSANAVNTIIVAYYTVYSSSRGILSGTDAADLVETITDEEYLAFLNNRNVQAVEILVRATPLVTMPPTIADSTTVTTTLGSVLVSNSSTEVLPIWALATIIALGVLCLLLIFLLIMMIVLRNPRKVKTDYTQTELTLRSTLCQTDIIETSDKEWRDAATNTDATPPPQPTSVFKITPPLPPTPAKPVITTTTQTPIHPDPEILMLEKKIVKLQARIKAKDANNNMLTKKADNNKKKIEKLEQDLLNYKQWKARLMQERKVLEEKVTQDMQRIRVLERNLETLKSQVKFLRLNEQDKQKHQEEGKKLELSPDRLFESFSKPLIEENLEENPPPTDAVKQAKKQEPPTLTWHNEQVKRAIFPQALSSDDHKFHAKPVKKIPKKAGKRTAWTPAQLYSAAAKNDSDNARIIPQSNNLNALLYIDLENPGRNN